MKLCTLLLLLLPLSTSASDSDLEQGATSLQRGELIKAEALLREATAETPKNPKAWSLLGRCLHEQEKFQEVLAVYETLSTFPTHAAAGHYNSGCAHARLDQEEEALDSLKKAVAAGFLDHELLATDPELDSLRDDERFDTLLPTFLFGADAFVEDTRVLSCFVGEAAGDEFGWVARSLGDLDGDGVIDFGTTSPSKSLGGAHAGRAYVYSSREGKLLYRVDGEPGWRLGNSIAGRVDVDGDGDIDVIVGAPGSGTQAGRVRVFDGASGSLLHELSAGEIGDQFGFKVSGIGDLNNDGCDDIAIGAPKADATGIDSGCVYIFSGKSGKQLYRIDGDRAGNQFGSAVDGTVSGAFGLLGVGAMNAPGGGSAVVLNCSASSAEWAFAFEADSTASNLGQYFVTILGDVDGDEVPDVFASDWNNRAKGPATGRVYVSSGATGEPLLAITGNVPGEGFGTSASYCGDVNHDGVADMVVGAWQHSSAARSGGAVYLHSGADGSRLATWTCKQAGDTLGFDSVGIGDVDGDGGTDFLLTAAWSGIRGTKTGRVWIVAGPVFSQAK